VSLTRMGASAIDLEQVSAVVQATSESGADRVVVYLRGSSAVDLVGEDARAVRRYVSALPSADASSVPTVRRIAEVSGSGPAGCEPAACEEQG
jgi:hypothetical protein